MNDKINKIKHNENMIGNMDKDGFLSFPIFFIIILCTTEGVGKRKKNIHDLGEESVDSLSHSTRRHFKISSVSSIFVFCQCQ